MIKLSEKDAQIAFDHLKHDHMACAKCLGPRMRVLAWVEEQRKLLKEEVENLKERVEELEEELYND